MFDFLSYDGCLVQKFYPNVPLEYILALNRLAKLVQFFSALVIIVEIVGVKRVNRMLNAINAPLAWTLRLVRTTLRIDWKEDYLRNGVVSEALRKELGGCRLDLSAEACITQDRKGQSWRIKDGKSTYMAQKEGSKLVVAKVGNVWMWPLYLMIVLTIWYRGSDHGLGYWLVYPFRQLVRMLTVWGELSLQPLLTLIPRVLLIAVKMFLFYLWFAFSFTFFIAYPAFGLIVPSGLLAEHIIKTDFSETVFRAVFFVIFVFGFFTEFLTSR